jgi:hypothetical protein
MKASVDLWPITALCEKLSCFNRMCNGKTVPVRPRHKRMLGQQMCQCTSGLDGGECFVKVTWLNLSLETNYDYCCNILHGFSQSLPMYVQLCHCLFHPHPFQPSFPQIVLFCTIWVEWTKENCKTFPCLGKLGVVNLNCHLSVPQILSYVNRTADSLLTFTAKQNTVTCLIIAKHLYANQ